MKLNRKQAQLQLQTMEQEIAELKRQHLEQHESARQQALQDLETIRQ